MRNAHTSPGIGPQELEVLEAVEVKGEVVEAVSDGKSAARAVPAVVAPAVSTCIGHRKFER
jgi:hypothetical protein